MSTLREYRHEQRKRSEAEVAALVVDHLEQFDRTEVFKEVLVYGKRADIVAVTDHKHVHVIEVKASLSLQLFTQALNWRNFAHEVSVATPLSIFASRHEKVLRACCDNYGIGVLCVNYHGSVTEEILAADNKNANAARILSRLHKQQKNSIAGNASNEFVTDFKITREKLVEFITKNGATHLSKLVKSTDHHYASNASARQCIASHIRSSVISELEIDSQRIVTLKEVKELDDVF